MSLKHCLNAVLMLFAATAWGTDTYTIYPVPHTLEPIAATARFTATVTVVAERGIDAATRHRAEQVLSERGLHPVFATRPSAKTANVLLGINGSGGKADRALSRLGLSRSVFRQPKFDRHVVSLTAARSGLAQLLVVGEHTDAVFCALASVEQMMKRLSVSASPNSGDAQDALPCVFIADYADVEQRGVIEGYYGYPYSCAVTEELIGFMMRHKMNTYVYGAKSDVYHSDRWREPYPLTVTAAEERHGLLSQDMVRRLATQARQSKVRFVWAIHPGDAFLNSPTVVADIMAKFRHMRELGSSVMFVPQIYCRSFARKAEQFERFFNALSQTPAAVGVYTTGPDVWSVPSSAGAALTSLPLGRKVGWWWNYPCNDNADGRIYLGPIYKNFADMPAVRTSARLPQQLHGVASLISNPMQQGAAAQVPLFSVADYAWNTAAFSDTLSWHAAVRAVVGEELAADFEAVAPYLSVSEPDALGTHLAHYAQTGDAAPLVAHLGQVRNYLRRLCDGLQRRPLLLADLDPWLRKLDYLLTAALQKTAPAATDAAPAAIASTSQDATPAFTIETLEGMAGEIKPMRHEVQLSLRFLTPFATAQ